LSAESDPAASAAPAGAPRAAAGNSIVRDAVVTIGARLALAVLIFGTDIALARLLGPDAKGRFSLVLLLSQLVAIPVGWGMDVALGVVSGRSKEDARRGFANALIWIAVVGGLAVVLACVLYGLPTDVRPRGPLAQVIPNLSASQFIYSALAIPGELFFAIGLFVLLGRHRVAAFNAIRVLRRATLLVLVVGSAAVARLSLDVALVCNLVALALTAVMISLAAWRDGVFGLRPSAPLLAEELGFGGRAIVGSLAERLQFRADSFLLNFFMGVTATGVYSVTSGLAETLWYIPNALGTVMFSRAVDPRAGAGATAAALTRSTIAVTLAFSVPAFVLGPWAVDLVYGTPFAEAGVALRLILPGVVAYSIVAVLSKYITGRGRPGTGTLVLLAGLVTNVVANLVLIPRFGIEGAAASSSISYILTAGLTLAVFLRISGRGLAETLFLRPGDVVAAVRRARTRAARAGAAAAAGAGADGGPGGLADGSDQAVLDEREPGGER
jgi:O-antigen/teichoic acid export membrane protein